MIRPLRRGGRVLTALFWLLLPVLLLAALGKAAAP